MSKSETTVPLSKDTKENHLRPHLRYGEAWDDLLRKMAAQYDPDSVDDEAPTPEGGV